MTRAYYNEIEPYAAQWIRNLITAGLIAPGDVDTRSIEDVTPNDIRGYTQRHFFAGIGVWSAALRAAGWPDDRPVWTGSCPCQPFSATGEGGGFADERHLWPAFHHLIRQCRPGVVFGEQVASPDGLAWLDLVHADMEAEHYAFAALNLCAAGVGAPHARQRLCWVANSQGIGRGEKRSHTRGVAARSRPQGWRPRPVDGGGTLWSSADWLDALDGKTRPVEPGTFPLAYGPTARLGRLRAYGNAIVMQVGAEFVHAFLDSEAA